MQGHPTKYCDRTRVANFPFIICDDKQGRPSLERRQAIAQQAETTLENMDTVYNKPDATCVVVFGSFIVQPIGSL